MKFLKNWHIAFVFLCFGFFYLFLRQSNPTSFCWQQALEQARTERANLVQTNASGRQLENVDTLIELIEEKIGK